MSQICDERPGVAFRLDVVPIVASLPEPLGSAFSIPRSLRKCKASSGDGHAKTGMRLSELVKEQDIVLDMQADRKRAALGGIAARIAARIAERVGRSHGAVLAAFLRREKLGPTAVGNGIAIPHARMEGIAARAAVLATLQQPVAFGTPGDASVDILLGLLWPTSDMNGFRAHPPRCQASFAEHWASGSAPAIPDASRGARLDANLRGSVAGVAIHKASELRTYGHRSGLLQIRDAHIPSLKACTRTENLLLAGARQVTGPYRLRLSRLRFPAVRSALLPTG